MTPHIHQDCLGHPVTPGDWLTDGFVTLQVIRLHCVGQFVHVVDSGELVTNFCCCFTVCTPPAHNKGPSDSLAAPAEAGQGVCTQLPEGAQVLGIYVDAVDDVMYQWGSCTDGYFALDMFGWAAWPTLVDVVYAISRRAGYVA